MRDVRKKRFYTKSPKFFGKFSLERAGGPDMNVLAGPVEPGDKASPPWGEA